MQEKAKLNIDQVALMAGVSRSVVSRVLNNRPKVSREARERVMRVIEEHDYRPSPIARGLSIDRTFEICIIMPRRRKDSVANGYWSLLHLGISEQCMSRGYVVSMAMISADTVQDVNERILKQRVFDGYILRSGVVDLVAPNLLSQDVPLVLIGSAPDHPELSSIEVDNFDGAYQATQYLAELGHRRIGMIVGDPNMQESLERRDGYLRVLEERGVEPDARLMSAGPYSERSGYEIASAWITEGIHPTAIVCSSDSIATGVLLALHNAGIAVPGDVSVIGFDDVPSAAFLTPPLTTVRQPIYEKGQQAADIIIDAIEGKTSGIVHVRLPAQLVVRESCAEVNPAQA